MYRIGWLLKVIGIIRWDKWYVMVLGRVKDISGMCIGKYLCYYIGKKDFNVIGFWRKWEGWLGRRFGWM